jgi:hypothetical protein
MKPTNIKTATQSAEQRARISLDQVKATEKKARAAKEKTWRTKLAFKLARRAFKKAKKAAKRARANAEQAQIALRELRELTAPATRSSRQASAKPKRNAPNQSSSEARRKLPVAKSEAGAKRLTASARQRTAQAGSVAEPPREETVARSTTAGPRVLEAAGDGMSLPG